MNWTSEYQTIAGALTSLPSLAAEFVFEPGGDSERPSPSSNLAAPSKYIEWMLGKADSERHTMGGTQLIEGEVIVDIYTEKLAREGFIVALADEVWSALDGISENDFTMLTMHRHESELDTEGFHGRRYMISYSRLAEPPAE